MSTVRVACGHCGATLKAPPPTWGRTLKCPKCRQPILIPLQLPQVKEIAQGPPQPLTVPPPIPQPPPIRVEPPPSPLTPLVEELEALREELSELRLERRRPRRREPEWDDRPRVQTIELTGKRWKGYQLLGMLGIALGLFLLCAGSGAREPRLGAFGALAIVLGVIFWLVGRIGAWWYHG